MRTDPLRVTAWCVVLLAAFLFVLEIRREPASPPPTGTQSSDTRGIAPVRETAYVGNIKSRKFHRATCQYASCPNCKARFATREEAIEANFTPGGCCHP